MALRIQAGTEKTNFKVRTDPDSGSVQASFIDTTARATGKGRTTVSLDAERGEKINGKAKIRIPDLW